MSDAGCAGKEQTKKMPLFLALYLALWSCDSVRKEEAPCEGWCNSFDERMKVDSKMCEPAQNVTHEVRHCYGDMQDQCGGCDHCKYNEVQYPCHGDAGVGSSQSSWANGAGVDSSQNQWGYHDAGDAVGFGNCKRKSIADSPLWYNMYDKYNQPSCTGVNKDSGIFMCDGDNTSISMDLSAAYDGAEGCRLFQSRCPIPLRKGTKLSFTAEWENCHDVWMAPLWISPQPTDWGPKQGWSGEIDFIETCRSNAGGGQVKCSIMCNEIGQVQDASGCLEKNYHSSSSSYGQQYFEGHVDEGGNWIMTVGGERVSFNPGYIQRVTDHSYNGSRTLDLLRLHSDIYNGDGGNDGWTWCGRKSPQSTCKFTVRNIMHNGSPLRCGSDPYAGWW
eukprot:TRINITY_DN29351_c0_g1_i2.p1 TRINITY_DN29351_c0_g1~~TRINITY_DN29351_c0_g1_i2.p1  ORF type:complete len:388 (+),score=25.36 TRINITY_DN29351_c0_g1_i2:51-1214(+)